MLQTSRGNFIPAGKAPQSGADAVKACYLLCDPLLGMRVAERTAQRPCTGLYSSSGLKSSFTCHNPDLRMRSIGE